jgi:hypothetical protein
MSIKKELMDNILTYRDERLPYDVGRKMVAIKGVSLERSKLMKRLSIAGIIIYIVVRIALEFASSN